MARSGGSATPSRRPGRSKRPGEPRGGRGRAAHPGASRAPRRRGVGSGGARRIHADSRPRSRTGPRSAARAVLHALHALRLGRRGGGAALPAARLLPRARPLRCRWRSSSRSCSRTWAPAPPGWPPSTRARTLRWWARSGSAGGRPRHRPARCWWAGGSARRPCCASRTSCPSGRRCCSASARRPTPRPRACSPGRWASPPTTAPPDGPAWSPIFCASSSTAIRRPPCSRAGRRRCWRRCVRSAPSAGWRAQLALESGHGLRLRRVLRLCRAHAGRVPAPVRGRPRARCRAAGVGALPGGRALMDLCGVELEGPILNGSGTFDAIAARRAFGDALLDALPLPRLRLQDDHPRAAPGQPAAAAVGDPRGNDQLDRAAQPRPRRLPGSRPARPGRAAGAARGVGHGVQPGRAGHSGGTRGRARRGGHDRAERVLPQRGERADHGSRSRPRPRAPWSGSARSPSCR